MINDESKLHIGIDFDNTIIHYDDLFYKYALIDGFIRPETARSKNAIREYLWSLPEGNEKWIYLQVVVYGERMEEATFKEGAFEFIKNCRRNDIKVSIISHKTEFDNLGKGINLRNVALDWMRNNGFFSSSGLGLSEDNVFFESTRQEKIYRIITQGCTHFIDDLIEIFLEDVFPKEVKKIYYNPDGFDENKLDDLIGFRRWDEIYAYFFNQ